MILGLDISSHTGWAIIKNGELLNYGIIESSIDKAEHIESGFIEDQYFLAIARDISAQIYNLILASNINHIWIEQTNLGTRSRSSQKLLEFIHCLLLDKLTALSGIRGKIHYVDTSRWRSVLKIRMSPDDKKNNKQVKLKQKKGKITPKHLAVRWVNENYGLELKIKDNDIADAICIATCGYLMKKSLKSGKDKISDVDFIKNFCGKTAK